MVDSLIFLIGQEYEKFTAMNYAHPETLVETHWLAEHLDDPQLRIIQMDMNSEAYDKEHIPGAVNINYELAHNSDGTFKSAEELQEIYGDLISTNKTIIPYCAIGARSAHTWFVLKYLLGCDRVKNYDGSWNEWSKLDKVPIAN